MKKIFFGLIFSMISILAQAVPTVNIYVHGTQQFGSKLLPKSIWYCPKGLHHISALPDNSMMVQDAKLLQQADEKEFDLQHYFTFGWSGKLGFDHRQVAGKQLYDELNKLLKKYKLMYGVYPKVRIITFSHGGNVTLNMVGNIDSNHFKDVDLELVLMACPVQKQTEQFIKHPAIARSFVIYSTFDLLQVVDRYKYEGKKYFPQRTFETCNENCKQILVTVNQSRLTHTDLYHAFMRHVPKVLHVAQKHQEDSHLTCDVTDSDFVCYNGINFLKVLQSSRKQK